MKTSHLLSTAAAALLITVSAASAQMKEQATPERAPAAQQKAPAEKVGPAMNAGQPKGPETTGQASPTQMSPGKNDAGKPNAAANSPSGKDAADIKARSDSNVAPNKAAADKAAADKAAPDKAAQGKPASDKPAADKAAQDQSRPGAAPSTAQSDSNKSTTTTTTTTGQGAAGASARLSTEQRTKITTVFKTQKVARVEPAKLNVSISVGTRVPSTVRFYPVPQEVVVIYPEWRGYDYIIVGSQILILQPGTHEIVAILDA